MKTTKNILGIALALTCSLAATLKAQNIYVANAGNDTVGEYTAAGATVNASLISGLNGVGGIAISGNDLFVVNEGSGTVGEYGLDGSTVNASLISGLWDPVGIAISPVPEPSAGALAGLSAAALWLLRRRK
jgi:DNA-binding beta-propeller fold protein YncE